MIGVDEGRALGGCGGKIRGWMCEEAGEGGEGVEAAVVGCSWQSGDNQQPDLCLTSLSPCPPHFSTQLYDALLDNE